MTKNNLKKYTIWALVGILAVVLFVFAMTRWEDYKLKKKGNEIVKTVEHFKAEHGRLPESLAEMGLVDDMVTQPFYTKRSDTTYDLYYGFGFDEGLMYSSDTKKWGNYPK